MLQSLSWAPSVCLVPYECCTWTLKWWILSYGVSSFDSITFLRANGLWNSLHGLVWNANDLTLLVIYFIFIFLHHFFFLWTVSLTTPCLWLRAFFVSFFGKMNAAKHCFNMRVMVHTKLWNVSKLSYCKTRMRKDLSNSVYYVCLLLYVSLFLSMLNAHLLIP